MSTANERGPANQPVTARPSDDADGVWTGGAVQGVAGEKPLTPNQCRKYLRKTVAAAYRDIVAGFVKEAKSGSCQHLKMATEVVDSTRRPKAAPREKGAAALLLEKLEREFPGRGF